MFLAAANILWFSPKATATTTITINPNTGTVGTLVLVNGTIDTFDGTYVIRWNQTLNITSGFAVEYNVSSSFIVPPTVGSSTGLSVSVELIDDTTGNIGTAPFTLYTAYHIKAQTPAPPNQLQVSATTNILVNVTGATANTIYKANVTVKDPADSTGWAIAQMNTNATGDGGASLQYPSSGWSGATPHTNYTGTYLARFNETLAETNFVCGLTNATEYKRYEAVNIRAMNYTSQPEEEASVNVKISVIVVFSENVSAVGGVVETSWRIPGNAGIGTYTVTVTNSTALGTVKSVPDIQTFRIVRAPSSLEVEVEDAEGHPLSGVTVEAHNASRVVSKTTSLDGLANFSLDVGNYTIKSLFYDLLFNTTLVDVPLAFQPNITIVCPAYTLSVHVLDSKNNALEGAEVSVYEWTSGTAQPALSGTTDTEGDITFPLNFGRYRLRTYKDNILLNETIVDLTEDTLLSTIRCSIYNADLSVVVTDYFGNPIPNVFVKLERRIGGNYVEAHSGTTAADGSTIFAGILGGHVRISAYVAGKLSRIEYLYLDVSRRVETKIDGYVVLGGFVMDASQFFTLAVVLVIIALFLIILGYKRVLRLFGKIKKTP